jgi:hypothetical protein
MRRIFLLFIFFACGAFCPAFIFRAFDFNENAPSRYIFPHRLIYSWPVYMEGHRGKIWFFAPVRLNFYADLTAEIQPMDRIFSYTAFSPKEAVNAAFINIKQDPVNEHYFFVDFTIPDDDEGEDSVQIKQRYRFYSSVADWNERVRAAEEFEKYLEDALDEEH